MQDLHTAQILHAPRNVFGEHHQLVLFQIGCFRVEIHEERSVLHVLHDDRSGFLDVRNDSHNVRMVQFAHDLEFPFKVRIQRQRRVERFHSDYCHFLLEIFELTAIDGAVMAFANLTLQCDFADIRQLKDGSIKIGVWLWVFRQNIRQIDEKYGAVGGGRVDWKRFVVVHIAGVTTNG